MDERGRVIVSMAVGALVGGILGYLFFTESGRRRRGQIEPAGEELMHEARRFRGTLEKVQDAAEEGVRMFNEVRERTRGGWSQMASDTTTH